MAINAYYHVDATAAGSGDASSWTTYTVPFVCDGWVRIRISR